MKVTVEVCRRVVLVFIQGAPDCNTLATMNGFIETRLLTNSSARKPLPSGMGMKRGLEYSSQAVY